jgi:hypothetical protein
MQIVRTATEVMVNTCWSWEELSVSTYPAQRMSQPVGLVSGVRCFVTSSSHLGDICAEIVIRLNSDTYAARQTARRGAQRHLNAGPSHDKPCKLVPLAALMRDLSAALYASAHLCPLNTSVGVVAVHVLHQRHHDGRWALAAHQLSPGSLRATGEACQLP